MSPARAAPGGAGTPGTDEARLCAASCGLDRLGASLRGALARVSSAQPLLVASGGCAGYVAGFVDGERFRVPQGRPLPFSLGLAHARPGRTVIAFLGDGEASGPGLGHLLHAARRGDPVHAVIVNNEVLGGGGGFPSPTTPRGGRTVATPQGSSPRAIDLSDLALDAGAAWVGRETVTAGGPLDALLEEFLRAPTFALLEVRAPCYPAYGQWNGFPTPEAMHAALERRALRGQAPGASPAPGAGAEDRFRVGRIWPPPEGAR